MIDQFMTADEDIRRSYRIRGRGTGHMSIEPYRSHLNCMWRFQTVAQARQSANDLWNRFLDYKEHEDFIGMDMALKFIQMGMMCAQQIEDLRHGSTRDAEEALGEISPEHKRAELTSEAALIFKAAFDKIRHHPGYLESKAGFMAEQEKRFWEAQRNAERGFRRVAIPNQEGPKLEPEKNESDSVAP